jgi:hypothetical protein
MSSKKSLIKIALGCDERIPTKAMGYIADLNADSAPKIIEDRLNQLAKYVPDLVEKYRAAPTGRCIPSVCWRNRACGQPRSFAGVNMKRDFEYWERAYFGWLGKLIAAVFLGIYLLLVIKIYIEPWAIETMCR